MGRKIIFSFLAVLFVFAFNTKSEAAVKNITLGTQDTINVSVGEVVKFSVDKISSNSKFYQYRDVMSRFEINANVGEYVFSSDENSDYTYNVENSGETKVTVEIYNDNDEYITTVEFQVKSIIDMSKVYLKKKSFKDYCYNNYYYENFETTLVGLENFSSYSNGISFKTTSSNKKMSVYCSFYSGKLSFAVNGTGSTTVTVTINGKKFKVKINIYKVYISGSNSLLMVPKQTKTIKVKGTKEKVKYVSSNKKIITVSKSGKIKAKKIGNAFITVKVGDGKLGVVVSVVTKTRKKVINYANKIGKNWKYSQAKRMQKGYYDCSSLVWKAYKYEKKYFGMKNYAPVAANVAKWCWSHKKTVKGNIEKNIQKMKYKPGALTFKTGEKKGRFKGIYHVEMFTGYTFMGFDSKGKPMFGTKWAARADNYFYGSIWAQP